MNSPGQPVPPRRSLETVLREWKLENLTIWDGMAGVAAILVFVGSFLPWVTLAGIISQSGTSSSSGVLTLVLGIVSLILLAAAGATVIGSRLSVGLRVGVAIAGIVVIFIAGAKGADIESTDILSTGSGLALVFLAGIAQTGTAIVFVIRNWNRPRGEPSPSNAGGVLAAGITNMESAEPLSGSAGARSVDAPGESAPTDSISASQDPAQAGASREWASLPNVEAMSPNGRLMIRGGGGIMALSALLSWQQVGSDSFPNVAGVGTSTSGTGLAVFVLGLSLLLRSWPIGVTLGKTLGSFTLAMVFLSVGGTSSGSVGAGAWIGMVGGAVAVLGALLVAIESPTVPALELARPLPAGVGAILAIVASFWLDWVYWPGSDGLGRDNALNGLDPDVAYGIPVLIFGALALVLIGYAYRLSSNGIQRPILLSIQVAGIAIAVIAGANVLGMMIGFFVFGSGPLVALTGGILLVRSARQA